MSATRIKSSIFSRFRRFSNMEEPPGPKLFCFSPDVNSPCFVLKWPEICVMLDCALNLQTLLNFTPCTISENQKLANFEASSVDGVKFYSNKQQISIDSILEVSPPKIDSVNFDEIDVILISNFKTLMALPYITENSKFKGSIYATDPTLQFGRLMMQDLIRCTEISPKFDSSSIWKRAEALKTIPQLSDLEPQFWRQIYTLNDVESCLNKIKPVSHREIIDLQGFLKISPVSSGYCIGGCNWVIETDYQKISYVSNSSILSTHSKALDLVSMKNSDALIFAALRPTPLAQPDLMMTDFCKSIINNLKMGGNVLAPCYSTGLIFDQLECLCSELDQSGLSHVPIYVLGFSMESSMAFANIYAEWLSENKQSKVFIPEEPFLHGYLTKNERIKVYTTCYQGSLSADLRTPCIVFASHPSLRLGDAVHFMQIWGRDPKNLLILSEPDFISPEVLSPYQPLSMKILFCPIDTNLSQSAVNQLITDLKPQKIFLPEHMNNKGVPKTTQYYAKNRSINLALDDRFRKVIVQSDLNLKKCDQDHYAGNLRGELSIFENKLTIKGPEKDHVTKNFDQSQPIGRRINFQNLVDQLKSAGFEPSILENETLIRLEKAKISLKLAENRTRVVSDENFADDKEKVKIKVIDIVLKCLDKL